MKKVFCLLISLSMVLSLSLPAFASGNIVSVDEETGVIIYEDACGGLVFSGPSVLRAATEEEQQMQLAAIAQYEDQSTLTDIPVALSGSNYIDYESNPIHIGTWGGIKVYARHTLGSYNEGNAHLTSYGYATWYNQNGYTALPYRNGNATVAGQDVVDVAKFSYFSIRDLETDSAMTLKVNDFGPNQQQYGSVDNRERIADLDKNDFISLHGNASAGVFYARTWVPIVNYNP